MCEGGQNAAKSLNKGRLFWGPASCQPAANEKRAFRPQTMIRERYVELMVGVTWLKRPSPRRFWAKLGRCLGIPGRPSQKVDIYNQPLTRLWTHGIPIQTDRLRFHCQSGVPACRKRAFTSGSMSTFRLCVKGSGLRFVADDSSNTLSAIL